MLNLKIDLLTFSKHSSVALALLEIKTKITKEIIMDLIFFETDILWYIYNFNIYTTEKRK